MALLCAALLACGCDPKPAPPVTPPPPPPSTPPPPPVKPKDPPPPPAASGAGTIAGKATFKGTHTAKRLRVDADPVCADLHKDSPLMSEEIVVGAANGLRWVAVYLAAKPAGDYPAPATEVLVDQKGCRYEPHVFGVRAGQPIRIRNSDPTMHNIHAMPKVNSEFNFGQAKAGMEEVKSFSQPEAPFKIKCDVHPWMSAYALVCDHPFFAVTGEDGSFEIKNVPAGDHTLIFWHEKLGEKQVPVKVEDGKTAQASAEFE
jgi:plastocyanin